MGYKPFGWRTQEEPMQRGQRQQLATGRVQTSGTRTYRTFEEFCVEQRIRVQERLRPPIKDVDSTQYEEHPRTALNDHLTRVTLHRDAEIEVRGRV
jgi:hypothetical protein